MDINCKRSCNKCGGGGGGTTARPQPGGFGCSGGVRSYSRSLPNAHYYTKLCTNRDGIKIISRGASDQAVERTAWLISHVMDTMPERGRVAASMNKYRFRHAVMGVREMTTHLPEHAFLPPYWDQRARGLGATKAVPLGSSAEENAMCYTNDRYRVEDITIHEFAHSLHLLGLSQVYRSFTGELAAAYNNARHRNLWGSGHYAMTNSIEYWAEGVQSYFDCNAPDRYAPIDRAQLASKDRALYNLMVKYLGNNPWKRKMPCS